MRRHWPILVFVMLLLGACVALSVMDPALGEKDVVQERLDLATPPLGPDYVVSQTFISTKDGLESAEILLVVYDQGAERPADGEITLTLRRVGKEQAERVVSLPISGVTHNQRLAFAFEPIPDSRDCRFEMTLSTLEDYGIGCWRTSDEAYAGGGAFLNGESVPGDLYLVTSYRYGLVQMLADGIGTLVLGAKWIPGLLMLLALPGFVLSLYLLPKKQYDLWTYAGWVTSLSIVFWPLILLWASVAGLSLAGGFIWAVVGLLLIAGLIGTLINRDEPLVRLAASPSDALASAAMIMILALTGLSRILQVRDLVLPAWVDSVHHTVVTQLIAALGEVPGDYLPFLQVNDFHYHFGFHANAAGLVWLTGQPADRAVLVLGQVLNWVPLLSGYALAVRLSGRRWAGVTCALVIGLLSPMPAYFVSWGRYTQLAGLCVLPVASLAVVEFSSKPKQWRPLALAALLAGGLFLVHYRVIVFYALFVAIWMCALWIRERCTRDAWWSLSGGVLRLVGLSLLLALPWGARLVLRILPQVTGIYEGWQSPVGYNDFPTGLLETGWTMPLLAASLGGLSWALVRRQGRLVAVGVWVALWFLVANLSSVGLPDIWLIHNSSVVISLWLPIGLLLGWLVADVSHLLVTGLTKLWSRGPWDASLGLLLAAAAIAMGGWGFWRMVDIVNPLTVLATQDDLHALVWAGENTPADSRFLINTRVWSGDLHTGSDGGWWLPIIADRDVTLPCVLYHQGDATYRQDLISFAQMVEETESVDAPELLDALADASVTHVFVGAKGGRLMPKDLDPSPHYQLVYVLGPTRIYAFVPEP